MPGNLSNVRIKTACHNPIQRKSSVLPYKRRKKTTAVCAYSYRYPACCP